MESRTRLLCEIEELKDFIDYSVDTNGNVISHKKRRTTILKPSYKQVIGTRKYGKYVLLYNRYKEPVPMVVARIVALAFIPTDDTKKKVVHINGDVNDDRMTNLQWSNTVIKKGEQRYFDNFIIEKDLIERIKKVHYASIQKGLQVSDNNTFLNLIINKALDDYSMQYGLRRILMEMNNN